MRNGIRPDFKKDNILISSSVRRARIPSKVTIPLSPAGAITAHLKVREGEHVLAGKLLAQAASEDFVNVHASISGYVSRITDFPHPLKREARAVEIESDQKDGFVQGYGVERAGWKELEARALLGIFQTLGLVRMDTTMRPLHACLKEQRQGGVHTLIINGCESEPYVTSRHSLMMVHAIEIVRGAEILRRALGVERVVIVTEDNKLEAAELIRSKIYFLRWPHFNVQVFPAKYPQEFDDILQREILIGDRGGARGGAAIYDVATAYAVYEAAALQKPFIERVVTIAGECVIEPANVWLRFGTSFSDAIKSCRGLLREPGVVLMNGPMNGMAQENLEAPLTPAVQAVLALPKEIAKSELVEPCIRCGFCTDVCPVEISPAMITLASEHEQFHVAYDYGIDLCNRCGNCSYVCPSKRPMLELIDYAWQKIQTELEPEKHLGIRLNHKTVVDFTPAPAPT